MNGLKRQKGTRQGEGMGGAWGVWDKWMGDDSGAGQGTVGEGRRGTVTWGGRDVIVL